jgi:hypothetical protein
MKMVKHSLIPSEAKRREKFFRKNNYKDTITHMQNTHHLSAINLMKRVERGARLIENTNILKGNKIKGKAILVHRTAEKLTDATIDAMLRTKEKTGTEVFESMNPKEKDKIWRNFYNNAIELLLTKIKKRKRLLEEIERIDRYFMLPNGLYKRRGEHLEMINKIVKKANRNDFNPEENLRNKLARICDSKRIGHTMKIKAMDVCLTASIYADIKHAKGERWIDAYRNGMQIAYEYVEKITGLENAIVELK